jgi:hypothetical protein
VKADPPAAIAGPGCSTRAILYMPKYLLTLHGRWHKSFSIPESRVKGGLDDEEEIDRIFNRRMASTRHGSFNASSTDDQQRSRY